MPPRGYPCRLGASGAQALVSACAHRLARTVFPGIGGHRAHHSPRRWHRGLALGLTGAALVELGTERGSAQRDGAGGAAIASANDRASAAINGYKNLNNRLGKFVNEPGDLIGKDSGPIPQDRGVGGGLPTNVIADGAITQPKLSPELQARLDVAGPAGPQGPPGPPGPPGNAASINGIPPVVI